MDNKRFTLFITLTALILALNLLLNPPKKQPVRNKNVAVKNDPADKKADVPASENGEKTNPDDSKVGPATPDPKPENEGEKPATRRLTNAQPRWVTLGSIDPATGFEMLVTLNNRGAAVERVELSSNRYHDLGDLNVEDAHGYLGHLSPELSGEGRGVKLNVVGPGTPAATAKPVEGVSPVGLEAGDVLLEVNDHPINSPDQLKAQLRKTKPGDTVKLNVERGQANLTFVATLGKLPLAVIRPDAEQQEKSYGPPSFLLTLESVGSGKTAAAIAMGEREINKLTSLRETPWEVTQATDTFVEFRFVLDEAEMKAIGQKGELEIFKRYRLSPTRDEKDQRKQYHVELEIEIKPSGTESQQVAYRLEGPNGLPLEGWWYANKTSPHWGGAGARDVIYKVDGKRGQQFESCSSILANAKKKADTPHTILFGDADVTQVRAVEYLAVDSQYFLAAMMPQGEEAKQRTFRRAIAQPISSVTSLPKGREKTLNVGVELQSESLSITADRPLKQTFTVFLGPKEPALLAKYKLSDAIELGWWWWVCGPMGDMLHGFYWAVASVGLPTYGIAIVMLTIVVRLCMLPISFKMTKNAQKMQALAPELKKITDKYKDDLQKRHQAQQELFQKHNVNMFAGCLPVFIQLPVFAGLYRLLSVDIELRQAPLVRGWEWCSNLAGPDQFWYWGKIAPAFLADHTGWFGPYLNVLPLITVGLFMMNQKMMTPPAQNEEQEMQQRIMSFMMIFFAAMFFKVPSGLCIYFIASSLWTLGEHKVLKKDQLLTPPTDTAASKEMEKNKQAAIEKRDNRKKRRDR